MSDRTAVTLDTELAQHIREFETMGETFTIADTLSLLKRVRKALSRLPESRPTPGSEWRPRVGDLVWWPKTPFEYQQNRIGHISAVNFRGLDGVVEIDFGVIAMRGPGGRCDQPVVKSETHYSHLLPVIAPASVGAGTPPQEEHHDQCPWQKADPSRTRSVCGCPEGWPKAAAPVPPRGAEPQEPTPTLTELVERLKATVNAEDRPFDRRLYVLEGIDRAAAISLAALRVEQARRERMARELTRIDEIAVEWINAAQRQEERALKAEAEVVRLTSGSNPLQHELLDLITLMPDAQTQELIDYIMDLRRIRSVALPETERPTP